MILLGHLLVFISIGHVSWKEMFCGPLQNESTKRSESQFKLVSIQLPELSSKNIQQQIRFKQSQHGKLISNRKVQIPRPGFSEREIKFSQQSRENRQIEEPEDLVSRSVLPPYHRYRYGISQSRQRDNDLVLYKFKIGPKSLTGVNPGNYRTQELNFGSYRSGIPGVAGKDYPIYYRVPQTNFNCSRKTGIFVDPQTRCQIFHICDADNQLSSSHICPNGTVFNDDHSICDWWFNVNCTYVRLKRNFWFVGLREQIENSQSRNLRTSTNEEEKSENLRSFPAPVTLPPSIKLQAHGALPPFILRKIRQRQVESTVDFK